MRRRSKIIIIIFLCLIFTYIIYLNNKKSKLNILAIGDGISSGEACENDDISFNDYLMIYFDNNKMLSKYNDDYSYKNNRIIDVINNYKDNKKLNGNYFQQLVYEADIITISIGEEELIKLSIIGDLSINYLTVILNNYDELLRTISKNTEAKIIVIGFYENKYLDKTKIIILNSELYNLTKKYNVIFININDLISSNNYFDNNCYYINNIVHQEISKLIINSI